MDKKSTVKQRNVKFPEWNKDDPENSLKKIYDWAVERAENEAQWYFDHRKIRNLFSQLLRTLTIFFAVLGGLCPLVDAARLNILKDTSVGQWGYIFFAIAAAMVLFDRFFGLSTGWMRYISTYFSLNKIIDEFRYEWLITINQSQDSDSPQKKTELLLEKLKNFSIKVDEQVIMETDAWITEFKSNLAELRKYVKSQAKPHTPTSQIKK